jgi:hypothetical protein
VKVVITKLHNDDSPPCAGKMMDIARGGAKLLLPAQLPLDDAVEIRLQSEALGLDLRLTAAICWCQPEGSNWTLGCRFVPPIPPDSMERLFVTGLLERRFFTRRPRRVAVTAQWELESGFLPAMLWDLSDGGFCLLMPTPRKMGGRVLVMAGDEGNRFEVPAKIQWEMHIGEGYLVGCQFVNRLGYEALHKLQSAQAELLAAKPERPSVRRRLRELVGALFTPSEEELDELLDK